MAMKFSQSLLIALLVATLCFTAYDSRHVANAGTGGPYQLMHHSNVNANAGVFRLDTATGEVSYCYLPGSADVICTRPVK
jgi:hypothetical protein